MKEVIVGQHAYMIDRLDAMQQFHVARRLVPVLAAFSKVGNNFREVQEGSSTSGISMSALLPIAEALQSMTDVDAEYIIKSCLSVVKRSDSGSWQYVCIQGKFVYHDFSMPDMVKLTSEVIMENMGDFFSGLQTV